RQGLLEGGRCLLDSSLAVQSRSLSVESGRLFLQRFAFLWRQLVTGQRSRRYHRHREKGRRGDLGKNLDPHGSTSIPDGREPFSHSPLAYRPSPLRVKAAHKRVGERRAPIAVFWPGAGASGGSCTVLLNTGTERSPARMEMRSGW